MKSINAKLSVNFQSLSFHSPVCKQHDQSAHVLCWFHRRTMAEEEVEKNSGKDMGDVKLFSK